MPRRRRIEVTWTGSRNPTAAERRAIARGVRDGTIRHGDEVVPARANPASSRSAKRAYRAFHWGNEPTSVRELALPDYSRGIYEIGKLRQVEYETNKGGEHAVWVHDFRKPFPSITATPAGKLGPIVGGGAFVTKRGIER